MPPDPVTAVPSSPASAHKALRAVALFETLKGSIALVVGFGLLSFIGRDAEEFAERLVNRMHLDPAQHFARLFINGMADLSTSRLWLFAGFAAIYATVRFVESYGLWHARRWAEWFAALSGAVYVPFEIYELVRRQTWLRASALIVNLAVVAYMVWLLTEARRKAARAKAGP
jgi:uncharacterized membrane protein (DUF2068 family)